MRHKIGLNTRTLWQSIYVSVRVCVVSDYIINVRQTQCDIYRQLLLLLVLVLIAVVVIVIIIADAIEISDIFTAFKQSINSDLAPKLSLPLCVCVCVLLVCMCICC